MPSLDKIVASTVVKLLLIGDSGSGKTGSGASLVKAGYKLRVLDMDAGWESLASAVNHTCPDKLGTVQVESFRDRYRASAVGPILDGTPRAFVSAGALLDKWPDGSTPSSWGPEYILVLDSLAFFANAAFNHFLALHPQAKDQRQVYGLAQTAVEQVISMLTNSAFNTNVIVTSHIMYVDLPDGTKKGYPTSIGQALSPSIPKYFNNVVQSLTVGGKRTIHTTSTALVDLKNTAAFRMPASLPIENGLATFFEVIKQSQQAKLQPAA